MQIDNITITKSKGFVIESPCGRISYAIDIKKAKEKRNYSIKKDKGKLSTGDDIKISEIDGYLVECKETDRSIFCPTLELANKKAKGLVSNVTKAEKAIDKQSLKAVGIRLRYAREDLCGLSQQRAAKLLGVSNSQLSKFETGMDKAISGKQIADAAKLYDVSSDYLLGLADDWERDIKHSQEKTVNSWILSELESTTVAQLNAIRVLHDRVAVISSSASHAITGFNLISNALCKVRQLNPDFDDEIRSGAQLVRVVEEHATLAAGIEQQLKRFNCFSEVAKKTTGGNFDMFKLDIAVE